MNREVGNLVARVAQQREDHGHLLLSIADLAREVAQHDFEVDLVLK
jgi:hypothetical protein